MCSLQQFWKYNHVSFLILSPFLFFLEFARDMNKSRSGHVSGSRNLRLSKSFTVPIT